MRRLDEEIHCVWIEQIRIFGVEIKIELHRSVLKPFNRKILRTIFQFFRHDATAALTARPIEFIIQPNSLKALFFSCFQNPTNYLEPFFGQIWNFTSRTRIHEKLRDADTMEFTHEPFDEIFRRLARHGTHWNQWIFHVFSVVWPTYARSNPFP